MQLSLRCKVRSKGVDRPPPSRLTPVAAAMAVVATVVAMAVGTEVVMEVGRAVVVVAREAARAMWVV